jgi:hypothetical protein
MYIIIVNGSLYSSKDSRNMFTMDELGEELTEWSGGTAIMDEDDNELSVEELIKYCEGCPCDIFNDNMVERGDDWVTMGIFEINV